MSFSWLLYCIISTFYINSALTNMCFEKLKFRHQFVVSLGCITICFFMPQSIGVWGNIIVFLLVYLFIIYLQKHPLFNALGMMLNYILGVSINYIITAILYILGVGIEFLDKSLLYYFIFNVLQAGIMHAVTYPIGRLYRKLIRQKLIPFYENKKKRKIFYLISLEIILCGLIFVFNVVFGNYIGYTSPILLFNGTLFFLFFLSTGIVIRQLYKTLQEDYELQARISQAENLLWKITLSAN